MNLDVTRKKLQCLEKDVGIIERSLKKLNRQEYTVIEYMLINRVKCAADVLAEQLGYEKATIYRIRDTALTKLARMIHGTIED